VAEVELLRILVAEVVVARVEPAGGGADDDGGQRQAEGAGVRQRRRVAASKVTVPSRATRQARIELKW
jgi:hypothetical protein